MVFVYNDQSVSKYVDRFNCDPSNHCCLFIKCSFKATQGLEVQGAKLAISTTAGGGKTVAGITH